MILKDSCAQQLMLMELANFLLLNVREVLYKEVNYLKCTAVEHLLPTRPIHENLRSILLCSPPHTFVSLKDKNETNLMLYADNMVQQIGNVIFK